MFYIPCLVATFARGDKNIIICCMWQRPRDEETISLCPRHQETEREQKSASLFRVERERTARIARTVTSFSWKPRSAVVEVAPRLRARRSDRLSISEPATPHPSTKRCVPIFSVTATEMTSHIIEELILTVLPFCAL